MTNKSPADSRTLLTSSAISTCTSANKGVYAIQCTEGLLKFQFMHAMHCVSPCGAAPVVGQQPCPTALGINLSRATTFRRCAVCKSVANVAIRMARQVYAPCVACSRAKSKKGHARPGRLRVRLAVIRLSCSPRVSPAGCNFTPGGHIVPQNGRWQLLDDPEKSGRMLLERLN